MKDRNETLTTYFNDNYTRLVKIARRRVGGYSLANAEDAVQEAFARACQYYGSYKRSDNLDGWFNGILRNCINQIKRQEQTQGVCYTEVEDIAAEPATLVVSQNVIDTIDSLSDRDGKIVQMYFFDGYRTREIGELLQVNHDVVRDVIRRFRIKLQ